MDIPKLRRTVGKDLSIIAKKSGFEKDGKYFRKYNANSISVLRAIFETRLVGDKAELSVLFAMGVNFPCVPKMNSIPPVKSQDGRLKPEDVDCTFRRFLHDAIALPPRDWRSDFWELSDTDEWNDLLPKVIELFEVAAVPWFERYDDLRNALDDLLFLEEDRRVTSGIGLRGSIIRNWNALFIAIEIEEFRIARECVDTLCSLSYAPSLPVENPVLLELRQKL